MCSYKKTGRGAPAFLQPSNLQTFKLSNLSTLPRAISHRITSFAHPHPLTPIESHSCKNRGEGVPSLAQASSSLYRIPPPSTFNFSTFNLQTRLLTTHYPLPPSHLLKPRLQMAHLYRCTCKKGPAAREPGTHHAPLPDCNCFPRGSPRDRFRATWRNGSRNGSPGDGCPCPSCRDACCPIQWRSRQLGNGKPRLRRVSSFRADAFRCYCGSAVNACEWHCSE
jgi:hypothetical protein